jgi:hypothetical protein
MQWGCFTEGREGSEEGKGETTEYSEYAEKGKGGLEW